MNYQEIFAALPPDIRSQTNARRVQKAVDDVKRLKQKARYVLTIDAHGNLIDVKYNAKFFANLIAVLAPATFFGVQLSEALVLEIGISRTRPYRAVEQVTRRDGNKTTRRLTLRKRVRSIRTHELAKLWPRLEKVFASATYQARSKWKVKDAWYVKSPRGVWQFERGIYFSVDERDRAAQLFVLNEERRRRHAFLREFAARLAVHMRTYRKPSYSDKRLKNLIGVREAIGIWKAASLTSEDKGVVVAAMPRRTQHLFQKGLSVFGLATAEIQPIRKTRPEQPFLKDGQIRLVRRQGNVHGKHCVVFEFSFKRRVREQLNL